MTPSADPSAAERTGIGRSGLGRIACSKLEGRPKMGMPYRARVDERWFLNLPGFHGGAYVVAYVEDTSARSLVPCDCSNDECERVENFEPRMILEIADGEDRINLEFDIDSDAGRANSLHKLDTLIAAIRVFRKGIAAEFEQYDRREREFSAHGE